MSHRSTNSPEFPEHAPASAAAARDEQRHSRLLTALAHAAARLLHARGLEGNLPLVLARLGSALQVSRLTVLPVEGLDVLARGARPLHWRAPDIATGGAMLDALKVRTELPRWLREAARGACLFGRIGDFPTAERPLLSQHGVRALAVFPVVADGRLWGLLVCEECSEDRIWQKSELDALRAVAELLGGAVARDRTGRALGRQEDLFRLLASSTSDVIVLGEAGGAMHYISPAVEDMLGHAAHALERRDPFDYTHPDDARRLRADLVARPVASAPERTLVHRLLHAQGHWLWVETRLRLLTGSDGRVQRWVASVRDISERRRMELQLAGERERGLATLRSIADAVVAVDGAGRIEWLNPAAERSTGWTLEEARGEPLAEVLHFTGRGVPAAADATALAAWLHGLGAGPLPLRVRDGSERIVQLSAAPIDAPGKVEEAGGLVLSFRDTSQAAVLLRELAYRTSHDALTGLLSREEFERALRRHAQELIAGQPGHVLCHVNLDRFKLVNDSCGHAAGDALLKEVATALGSALDEADLLGRLGGDEFGVLLHSVSLDEAADKAQRLLDALTGLRFAWGGRQFAVSASVGVAPVAAGEHAGASLLAAAEAACVVARERGRERVHVLEPSDLAFARRQAEARWVPRLHTALEIGDFHLQAQDIVPTAGGTRSGRHIEVLIALPAANGRLIPPGEFLPAARRFGLMGRIDRWVLAQVTEWLARRERGGAPSLELVAVNLCGSSLSDPEFRDFAEEQVRQLRNAHQLCFEITEGEAVANLAEATEFIQRMKDFGCRFALDDFGSGLSSFAWLKRLPVDFIKVDGQFVRDIVRDPVSRAMVESVHRIARVMGLRTVAEFVESAEIFEAVRALGIDYCQGYHFGCAVPLHEID